MNTDAVKLSILIPTYNHESYIENCIQGILKQKVNFNYEVLIGEDCSTDDTRGILQRLEKDLPSQFHIYYREHNLGPGDFGNVDDLIARSKGEYLTVLEGDDFWTYEEKLQKQIDFLDQNPDYIAVAHNCVVVDHYGQPRDKMYTECKDEEYTLQHYLYDILPGQTATIVYRSEYTAYHNAFLREYKQYDFYPGDRVKAFLQPLLGKVACIQEPWSAYRFVEDVGQSYSAGFRDDDRFRQNQLLFFKSEYLYAQDKNLEDAVLIFGKIYYLFLFKYGVRKKDLRQFWRELKQEKYAFNYAVHIIYRIFKKLFRG
ncbi:MAG: glycosyltransferase family 2 protein [Agathobacter sp.]|nr:glycosyltransferase family 2 protein [Agathobacter sp.]